MISLSTCCLSWALPGCQGDSDRLPCGLLRACGLLPLGEHFLAAASGTAVSQFSAVYDPAKELEPPGSLGCPALLPVPDVLLPGPWGIGFSFSLVYEVPLILPLVATNPDLFEVGIRRGK